MVDPLLIIPLSAGLATICGGLLYLLLLNQQEKKRYEAKLLSEMMKEGKTVVSESIASEQLTPEQITPKRISAEQPAHHSAAHTNKFAFATKSDLEMLALKVENHFFRKQIIFERFILILVILVSLMLHWVV